jgi:hypothetical protein
MPRKAGKADCTHVPCRRLVIPSACASLPHRGVSSVPSGQSLRPSTRIRAAIGDPLAKPNFRHSKRQRELAKKTRQHETELRKAARATERAQPASGGEQLMPTDPQPPAPLADTSETAGDRRAADIASS